MSVRGHGMTRPIRASLATLFCYGVTFVSRATLKEAHEFGRHNLAVNRNTKPLIGTHLARESHHGLDFGWINVHPNLNGDVKLNDVVMFFDTSLERGGFFDNLRCFVSFEFIKHSKLLGLGNLDQGARSILRLVDSIDITSGGQL